MNLEQKPRARIFIWVLKFKLLTIYTLFYILSQMIKYIIFNSLNLNT